MKLSILGRWSLYASIFVFSVLLVITLARSGVIPINVESLVDRYVEFSLAILLSALFTVAILSYERIRGKEPDAR